MHVLLSTEFAASRKEPLVETYYRVLAAFRTSGMEAMVRFSLSDTPAPGGVSSVDRVLKRFLAMEPFLSETAPLPPLPAARRISNQGSDAIVDAEILQTILAGVPRSFPFHNIVLIFTGPEFGEGSYKSILGEVPLGVTLGDSWWVNGRNRSLTAFTMVEAEVKGKNPGENPALPQDAKPETPVAAIGGQHGRVRERTGNQLCACGGGGGGRFARLVHA